MWPKVLTVINTVLILSGVGAGFFAFDQYTSINQKAQTELTKVVKTVSELEKTMEEADKNPFMSKNFKATDSLKDIGKGKLVGFVDIEGYLSVNPAGEAEFVFEEESASDEDIVKLSSSKGTDLKAIKLGCEKTDKLVLNTNLEIKDSVYEELTASSKDETVKIRFGYNGTEKSTDKCLSEAVSLQVISEELRGSAESEEEDSEEVSGTTGTTKNVPTPAPKPATE
jgi:hypothetical protein